MNVKTVSTCMSDIIHVVIESPQYSSNKYMYDAELKEFRLKKALPKGTEFPFDFGFIPNTLCDDGEPLQALVLIEGETYPGCLLTARVIGVLEATETAADNKPLRNDRLIAVSIDSYIYKNIQDVKDLDKDRRMQVEHFFKEYNRFENRIFKPLKWSSAAVAWKKIDDCKE